MKKLLILSLCLIAMKAFCQSPPASEESSDSLPVAEARITSESPTPNASNPKVSGADNNKKKKKDEDKKPPAVKGQQLSTRNTDDGKINGIEFTFTQSAYELNGSTVQKDTLFQLPSGFVIDIDVLTFQADSKKYVRIVYAPYSNGKQSQAGTEDKNKTTSPVIYPIKGINAKVLCMLKEDYDTITKSVRYASGICKGWQLASGQLSVPFKLRPMRTFGADTLALFRMTTDVTIGVYAGPRLRPSWKTPDFFITFPFTAGLTFVNVSNNTTTLTQPDEQVAEIVPGFTWSMGLIFQYRRTNFGVVFGRDYASDYAHKWIYHNDPWYSFAIGYSFLK